MELTQTKTSSGDYTKWPDFVLFTSKCKGERGGCSLLMGKIMFWAILEVLSVIRERYNDTREEGKNSIWTAEDDSKIMARRRSGESLNDGQEVTLQFCPSLAQLSHSTEL